MTEPHEPDLEPTGEELAIADELSARRPAPAPGFRGALARRLHRLDAGYSHRPPNLWPRSLTLIGGGTVLVIAGLLVALGG